MSYRRRRGLGSRDWWPDWWPWGREAPVGEGDGDDRAPGGGPDRLGGDGGPEPPWRSWAVGLALLVGLFGAGYLVSALWLFPGTAADAVPGEVVEVPELVGLTEDEARASLESAGLGVRVRSEMPHPQAPEGAVVAQSPLPGQLSRPGAPVSVTLSLGPDRRVVPDLRGLSDRQGRIVLERLGFRVSVDSARSDVERGRVVGTQPQAGSEMAVPADVRLVVSRGPQVARVPDLVGLHVDDVRDRLAQRNLELGDVTWDPGSFAAPGRVVGQSPAPGYSLRLGGRVSVRVSGSAPPTDTGPAGARPPREVPVPVDTVAAHFVPRTGTPSTAGEADP